MSKEKVSFLLTVTLLAVAMLVSCSPKTGDSVPASNSSAGSQPAAAPGVSKPPNYPTDTIHWIAPVAAGAAVDLPTRALADVLSLSTNVVVENIAGANQTIGTAEAVRRPADGYTLLTMANACGISQPLMGGLAYKMSDLRHLAMLAPMVQAIVTVRADSAIKDINDFLALLSSEKRYAYGVPNAGGYGHLAIASTLSQLGHYGKPNGVMVVYNGSAATIAAVLNGEATFAILDSTDAISRVSSGEMRAIVVLHNKPCDLFPGLPIISNHGVNNMDTFIGLKWISIRADTDPAIADWLKQELNKAIQTPKYQDYLAKMGFGALREYSEEEINGILEQASKDYGNTMKTIGMLK
jgi:tripartite-type tricarboxylate transporter receptor subunit TctC